MGIRLENHNYGRVENVCAWLKEAQARHKLLGDEIKKAKQFVGRHYGWQKLTGEMLTATIGGVEVISSLTVVAPYQTWKFDVAKMIGEDKSKDGGVDNKSRRDDPRGGILGDMVQDQNMDMDEFNSYFIVRKVGPSIRLK